MLSMKELNNIPLKKQFNRSATAYSRNEGCNNPIKSRQRARFFEYVRYFYTELLNRSAHYVPIGRQLWKSILDVFIDPVERVEGKWCLTWASDLDTKWNGDHFNFNDILVIENDVSKFSTSEEVKNTSCSMKSLSFWKWKLTNWFNPVPTKERNRLLCRTRPALGFSLPNPTCYQEHNLVNWYHIYTIISRATIT